VVLQGLEFRWPLFRSLQARELGQEVQTVVVGLTSSAVTLALLPMSSRYWVMASVLSLPRLCCLPSILDVPGLAFFDKEGLGDAHQLPSADRAVILRTVARKWPTDYPTYVIDLLFLDLRPTVPLGKLGWPAGPNL